MAHQNTRVFKCTFCHLQDTNGQELPIQGYERARIRSSAPGKPNVRKQANNGNISTTPDDVSTLTISDVTEVIRKNERNDIDNIPIQTNKQSTL